MVGTVVGLTVLLAVGFAIYHKNRKHRHKTQIKALGGRLRESNEALEAEKKEKEKLLLQLNMQQRQKTWGSLDDFRLARWNQYNEGLKPLKERGILELPTIPEGCKHNAHMFYIKCKDIKERTALIDALLKDGIYSAFHYIPLHTAPAGQKFGRFHGEDVYTTKESERLTRLPMYYGLSEADCDFVINKIKAFYGV